MFAINYDCIDVDLLAWLKLRVGPVCHRSAFIGVHLRPGVFSAFPRFVFGCATGRVEPFGVFVVIALFGFQVVREKDYTGELQG